MKIYVSCTKSDSTTGYLSYEGMDQATITSTLTGCGATGITFISESDFNSGVAAQVASRGTFR